MIRKFGWLLGTITLAFTGIYTIVYVYRWEWNRALFVGMMFVAVEVAAAAALVLRRLGQVEQKTAKEPDPQVLAHLRATAPERDHFAWLERSMTETNVFITVLLGAGVLLSGVTWIVDRIATRTALPTLEQGLAKRIDVAAFPDRPFVPTDAELLAQAGPYADDPDLRILLGPEAGRVTRVLIAGIVVVALAIGVGALREQLETRHETVLPGSRLVVDATARVRGSKEHAPALARGLVASCLVEAAADSDVIAFDWGEDEHFRFVARPALDEPDRRQLRGCLEDIRVPRLLVSVNGMTTKPPAA